MSHHPEMEQSRRKDEKTIRQSGRGMRLVPLSPLVAVPAVPADQNLTRELQKSIRKDHNAVRQPGQQMKELFTILSRGKISLSFFVETASEGEHAAARMARKSGRTT